MVTSNQELSLQLESVTKKRGRPSTGQAKSSAERVREHRERKRELAELLQRDVGWVSQAQYDQVQRSMIFYRDSVWKMESTIQAMQREQALLIEERAKLFAEVDRLHACLAENGSR